MQQRDAHPLVASAVHGRDKLGVALCRPPCTGTLHFGTPPRLGPYCYSPRREFRLAVTAGAHSQHMRRRRRWQIRRRRSELSLSTDASSRTLVALKYALSTSFGSLCFASLVSAPAAAVNWFFRPELPEPEPEEGADGPAAAEGGEEDGRGAVGGGWWAVWSLRAWRTDVWEKMQMDSTVPPSPARQCALQYGIAFVWDREGPSRCVLVPVGLRQRDAVRRGGAKAARRRRQVGYVDGFAVPMAAMYGYPFCHSAKMATLLMRRHWRAAPLPCLCPGQQTAHAQCLHSPSAFPLPSPPIPADALSA